MRIVSFHVRPHLHTLDDLIVEARAYAEAAMRAVGTFPATLLALTPWGVFSHSPERLATTADKDQFVLESRLLLVATQANMCAMVLESWMTDTPHGKIPDLPPSQHPDRREVVTICAESRQQRRFLTLPIQRSALGVFSGLGENTAPAEVQALGPFANLLKMRSPRKSDVRHARRALEAMVIRIELNSGFSTN